MALTDPVTTDHAAALDHVGNRIAETEIEQSPFPHLIVENVFPDDYYEKMLEAIPPSGEFEKVVYPGTGVGLKAKKFHDYGLAYRGMESHPFLNALYEFLKSDRFCRLLLDRFSRGESWIDRSAIPEEKHLYFKDGRCDFTSVFDLHKDLPGYEITPHPDNPQKIVTFQFYMEADDSVREYGTLLCSPKVGVQKQLQKKQSSKVRELVRRLTTRLTGPFGVGQTQAWYAWEHFDIAKVSEALPNCFLAFAPNEASWHGVRLDIPSDNPVQERTVLRGFIRSGGGQANYIADFRKSLSRRVIMSAAHLMKRKHR